MKAFAIILWILWTGAACAQTNHLERLLIGDKLYTDVEVMRITDQYAVVRYEKGVAQIPFSNCPPEIRQQLRSAMGLPDLSSTNGAAQKSAEADVPHPGFGKFQTANVVSVEGPMASWTKCQLQISNKTDTALLYRLPETLVQYFKLKTQRSNEIVEASEKLHEATEALKRLIANLPHNPPPRSGASLVRALLPLEEKEIAIQKQRLESMQQTYRDMLFHEPESTRIQVRQTGQVYQSLTVWDCAQ